MAFADDVKQIAMLARICVLPLSRSTGPERRTGYLTATLEAIINGHKQSQIDDLLPWNYATKV